MKVFRRKVGETIRVTGPCVIKLLKTGQSWGRIGVEADHDTRIFRGETSGVETEDSDGESKSSGNHVARAGDAG